MKKAYRINIYYECRLISKDILYFEADSEAEANRTARVLKEFIEFKTDYNLSSLALYQRDDDYRWKKINNSGYL